MVENCRSWMRTMLQIDAGLPALPSPETRLGFLERYAAASGRRLEALREKPAAWFEEEAAFFDVRRTRAWILLRRFAPQLFQRLYRKMGPPPLLCFARTRGNQHHDHQPLQPGL